MCKAENSLSRLVHPLDDSSAEVLDIKRCLLDIGISEADVEWLVALFKRPDCYGDPSDPSIFNEEFSQYFQHILSATVEKLNEPIQAKQDRHTRLAFLFYTLLGFGTLDRAWLPKVRRKASDNASDVPEWVHEFQKHAKFAAQNLDWGQLTEQTHFDDLLPFLFTRRRAFRSDRRSGSLESDTTTKLV